MKHEWIKRSNLTLSSLGTSGESNPAVTLESVQLDTCHWNIININVNIKSCNLSNMTLMVSKTAQNLTTDIKSLLSAHMRNSTIKQLTGNYIDLKVSDVTLVDRIQNSNAIFALNHSKAVFVVSEFRGISMGENYTGNATILFTENSQVQMKYTSISLGYANKSSVFAMKSNISIIACDFEGNQASEGGCINIVNTSTLDIRNCSFRNHYAGHGGAIHGSMNSTISIESSSFIKNMAVQGGTIFVAEHSKLTLNNCTFLFNKASMYHKNNYTTKPTGGAIAAGNAEVNIRNSKFDSNTALEGFGGAIALKNVTCVIESSVFSNNVANQGGAVYSEEHGYLTIKNTSFLENIALFYGGAIFGGYHLHIKVISSLLRENIAFQGGAVKVQGNVILNISKCTIEKNLVLKNVTIVGKKNKIPPMGGAIVGSDVVKIFIENSTMANNSAIGGFGGAIDTLSNVKLIINNSVLASNAATVQGGSINAQDNVNVTLVNCRITKSKAKMGGAISTMFNVAIHIINCTLTENIAVDTSVMYVSANCSITAEYCEFSRNRDQYAGAIAAEQSIVKVTQCRFLDNIGAKTSCFLITVNSLVAITDSIFLKLSPALIEVQSSKLSMSNCTFANSLPAQGTFAGNLITVSSKGKLDLAHCSFDSISYTTRIFSVSESFIKMDGVSFHKNIVGNILEITNGFISMTQISLLENKAFGDGGLFRAHGSSLYITLCLAENNLSLGKGGIVYMESSNISTCNSTFKNNTVNGNGIGGSGNGGVVYSVNRYKYSIITFINSFFLLNKAAGDGAVLYALHFGSNHFTDIAIDSCQFLGNTASSDSAIFLDRCSSFRTSKCFFKTTISNSDERPSIYFHIDSNNIEYLTYETDFGKRKINLSSSDDLFQGKAVSRGHIKIQDDAESYNMTHSETPYAACRYLILSDLILSDIILSYPIVSFLFFSFTEYIQNIFK